MEPGYKHIIIRPKPGGNLDFVKVELKSLYGMIKSEWSIENRKITVKVVIPCNTTAELTLPDVDLKDIIEDSSNSELKFIESDGGIKVEIGSGEYVFCCLFKKAV